MLVCLSLFIRKSYWQIHTITSSRPTDVTSFCYLATWQMTAAVDLRSFCCVASWFTKLRAQFLQSWFQSKNYPHFLLLICSLAGINKNVFWRCVLFVQVRNPASGYCLDSLGAKPEHSARMGVYICHGQGGNQVCMLYMESRYKFSLWFSSIFIHF